MNRRQRDAKFGAEWRLSREWITYTQTVRAAVAEDRRTLDRRRRGRAVKRHTYSLVALEVSTMLRPLREAFQRLLNTCVRAHWQLQPAMNEIEERLENGSRG